MTIGQNIGRFRKAHNLTQSKLAEKLGVTEQAISKWENGVCHPDIGIIPRIAGIFRVSIDHIFGFRLDSYDAEVDTLITQAETLESQNTPLADIQQYIDYFIGALVSYPNSEKLKLELAWYYFMAYRMHEIETERTAHLEKAIVLCHEVTAGHSMVRDNAHVLLARIYAESNQKDKALAELDKRPAGNDTLRMITMARIYEQAGDSDALQKHTQQSLWACYQAMHNTLRAYSSLLTHQGKGLEAEKYRNLHLKILSMFDEGGSNFGLCAKMHCHLQKAFYWKAKNKQSECAEAFSRVLECAEKAKTIHDHHVSALNAYFSTLETTEDNVEEHMTMASLDDFVAHFKGKFANYSESPT